MGADVTIELFDLARYQKDIAPALDCFFRDQAPLVLAAHIRSLGKDSPGYEALEFDIEDGLSVLEGRQAYSPSTNHQSNITLPEEMASFVRFQFAYAVVSAHCVLGSQNVSRTPLPLYLYKHSRWIEEYLCFEQSPSGGQLEYSSSEYTELFSRQEAEQLLIELQKVPAAPSDIEAGFSNLKHVVGSVDYCKQIVLTRSVC